MNNIPDCTLVTSCFDLTKYNNGSRSLIDNINNMKTLLEVPCYLVINTDNNCIDLIKEIRNSFNLDYLTKYNVTNFEDLHYYKYINTVNSNRENYWPTRDSRTCDENHILQISKTSFVLQTINSNPFNTSKFGWIGSSLSQNFSKICEDYTLDKLIFVLNNITDKFHLQILNVTDKKYIKNEHKKEYYREYRWVMCGSFYTMGKEIGLKILNRFDTLFEDITTLGYGDGDEMIYLEILDEFYDDIHRSYGDYGQIINNFIEPTRNFNYIYHLILKKYLDFGYNRECYDCASILLHFCTIKSLTSSAFIGSTGNSYHALEMREGVKQIESCKVIVDSYIYMNILFSYYVSAFYYRPTEVLSICNNIYDIIFTDKQMALEFNKNKDFFHSQLKFCNQFKKYQKLVICVFACATVEKYKMEILKIEETWGNCASQNGVKVLYFLGEDPTDLQDDDKYIYLKGVKNDYLSASDKQNLGLKYIYEKFNTDFVFCCGSDTYVNVEKLLMYIEKFDPNKNLYIGGHGCIRHVNNKDYYYHSGGGGFILSKECLYNIYLDLANMLSDWTKVCNLSNCYYLITACDASISYFLQNKLQTSLEIIKDTYRFLGCNHKGLCHNNTVKCCYGKINIDTILTCHSMTLSDFDEYTDFLKNIIDLPRDKIDYFEELENPFIIDIDDKNYYDINDLKLIQNKLDLKNIDNFLKSIYPSQNFTTTFEEIKRRTTKGLVQRIIDISTNVLPIKELFKIGDGGNRKHCFVCCTQLCSDRNVMSQTIIQSLQEVGFNGHFMLLNGGFPNPTGKEMKYIGVPYCFKIFMMLEAKKLGFDKVIWLDAACYAVNNPEKLFDLLYEDDAIFKEFPPNCFQHDSHSNIIFPKTIDLINKLVDRDIRNDINVNSIVFGLNLTSQNIISFIEEYYKMVQLGLPFLSSFPEEIVFASIFNKPEYKYVFKNRHERNILYIHESYLNKLDSRKNGYYFVQRGY